MIKITTKGNLERKGFLALLVPVIVHQGGTSGQDLEAGPEADAISHRIQDCLPRDGSTHRELSPPTSIINQENFPLTCLRASLVGYFFSVEVPSSQMTLT